MDHAGAQGWLRSLQVSLEATRVKVNGEMAPLSRGFEVVRGLLVSARENRSSIWWVGNGGSASICSHLAQDVMNKLAIRSMAFTDASLLTCMANDFGYPQVYAQPLRQLAAKGDLLIAISSAGNSENILNCAALARELSMDLVTLSGFSEANRLWSIPAAAAFHIAHNWYGIVEVAHLALLHGIIEALYLEPSSRQERTATGVQ